MTTIDNNEPSDPAEVVKTMQAALAAGLLPARLAAGLTAGQPKQSSPDYQSIADRCNERGIMVSAAGVKEIAEMLSTPTPERPDNGE